MRFYLTSLTCLLLVLSVISCKKSSPEEEEYPGMVSVQYEEITTQIPNPERGFYSASRSFASAADSPLSVNAVKVARSENRTLFILEYWLMDFRESDISEDFLSLIRTNFQRLREGGAKCIIRFGYNNLDPVEEPEKSKPYDADKAFVLKHIAQLKPILQENADVILVMQTGFIGIWGEWYYTDHFPKDPSTAEEYAPWKEVADAVLDAMPVRRQVALRTASAKMNMYGYSIADTITRAQAHGTDLKSRLTGHNDCFLVDYGDRGTFKSAVDREYWNAESRYTIMGGETCGNSSFCACTNALEKLQDNHYTYLNASYHQDVLKRWSREECFEEIRARLGYRLLLTKGFFEKEPAAGQNYRLILKIRNDGFAAPMNPRDALLVLSDASGKVLKTYPLESDPRYWMPGVTQVLDRTIEIPADAGGKLKLSLSLPDPEETLCNKPEYAIRLANKDVWDEKTGMNTLTTIEL